jgi:hypothetical protein
MRISVPCIPWHLLGFVVVQRLPKTDPDVEQSEAAADATKESVRDHRAELGIREQEIVIGPFGCPGQDDQKDARDGADQYKKKNRGAMEPELNAAIFLSRQGWIEKRGLSRGLIERRV